LGALIVLAIGFRLTALFLVRYGSASPDWSDFVYYHQVASLSAQGYYPDIQFWVEYPPLFPWLAVGAYQLSLLLPVWIQPDFWFELTLSLVLAVADGAAIVAIDRLGDAFWGKPAGRRSAIVVQVPVNTWQAYNSWGGNSLYDVPGAAVRGNRVSFDRPYAWSAPMNQNPRGWEFPLVLYLEQSGYDVSYQTDLDTDSDPASLLEHRLVIDIGHDEYWTQAMRQGFETARDAGVNLAFIGANDAYWRIRYEDGGRTIVVYKSRDDRDPIADPQLQTGLFRVMDRPECELIGIQHEGGLLNWQPGDFAVVPSSLDHPWLEDTGFDAASTLPGLVSIETDTIPGFQSADSSCGHQLTVFFHHEAGGDQLGNADTTAYTAPSGAIVFASGSKRFSWGLADPPAISGRTHGLVDPRLQRFVHNMLDDLSSWRIADLGLTLTTQTSKIRRGKPVKILAVISNQGPDDATDGALDLTLPTGMTFVRVASTGLRCTRAPLHCTIAPLPPGSTVQAVFTLRLVAPGPHQLSARALAIGGTDPDVARSQAQLVISPSQS